MMSITLRQPLASLLVMGPKVKPSLLRVGSTRYTGQVLIIAAYDWDEETEADCEFAACELIRRGLPALPLSPPLSFAVGLARVVECHEHGEPLHELDAILERWDRSEGDGLCAWRFAETRQFHSPIRLSYARPFPTLQTVPPTLTQLAVDARSTPTGPAWVPPTQGRLIG